MVGHAYYPALQGRKPLPATLSRQVVGVLLRRRIAYRGLVLTDDLEMGAIGPEADPGRVALEALRAGSDAVMFCGSEEKIVAAHEAILGVFKNGGAAARDLQRPLRRALALKKRHLPRRRSRFSPGSLRRCRLLLESLGPAATGADPTARL
jgi:beta-N-acetylhexosaminidase